MKKWHKILLITITSTISYTLTSTILRLTSLDEQTKNNISFTFFILPIIIYIFIIRRIIQKENEEISKISPKIKKLNELNNSYEFKEITKKKYNIIEREYSRKSLDRVTGSSIIRYRIENNIDSFRTNLENAIYNIKLLEDYNKKLEEIAKYESINTSTYSTKKFKRMENRVFNSQIHRKKDFLINLNIEVNYQSSGGKVNESRYGKYSFDALVNIYNEWQNGNKYEVTKKIERKIMNDNIRYNVLKRDNYTCQICGIKAKDGAKLHVDHIIPVSKGGKTVMSNLQTLCDRCNIGKSDKTDDDFDKSYNNNSVCPLCGGKLTKRKGKYGYFIGCSNYPKCSYNQKTSTSKKTTKK